MQPDWQPAAVGITDFGNLALVGPAAALVWLWLFHRRGIWAALRYQWPILITFGLTVSLKMVSRAYGGGFLGTPFALSTGAPSGHMAMSTVVYGGVALLLLRRGLEPLSLLTTLLTIAGLIGVGVTRVLLDAHTPADVVCGFFIGGCGAYWIGRTADVPMREPTRHVAELVFMMSGLVILLYLSGFRFDSAAVL